jgi:hypothetical protein
MQAMEIGRDDSTLCGNRSLFWLDMSEEMLSVMLIGTWLWIWVHQIPIVSKQKL